MEKNEIGWVSFKPAAQNKIEWDEHFEYYEMEKSNAQLTDQPNLHRDKQGKNPDRA